MRCRGSVTNCSKAATTPGQPEYRFICARIPVWGRYLTLLSSSPGEGRMGNGNTKPPLGPTEFGPEAEELAR